MSTTDVPAHLDDPRLRRWRSVTGGALSAIAIGSLPILLLETQRDELPRHDQWLIDGVNVVVLVAFALDYFVGLWLSPDRRTYFRKEWLELALTISQALVFLPSLASIGVLRAARAARMVRVVGAVVRVIAIAGMASREGRRVLRERATSFALTMAAMTWLSGAVGFTLAEDVGVDGRLESFYDALWWSLATITTVGYGDIAPITGVGRIIAAFTMIVGISVFAILTAKIAEFFTRNDEPA